MKVSRKEMIRIRKNLLKEMDNYLRANVDENLVIDIWFAVGLEDGWDDDILTEYASDEDLWMSCVNAFRACCIKEKILK